MIRVISLFAVCVVLCGCSWQDVSNFSANDYVSMNVQRASLNAGGQIATAALLDKADIATVDQKVVETKKIVADVRTLVQAGGIGEYTQEQLSTALNKIVPTAYQVYSNQIVAALSGVTLPTDKIGSDNVLRIVEVLDGIEERCTKYDKTGRINKKDVFKDVDLSKPVVVKIK